MSRVSVIKACEISGITESIRGPDGPRVDITTTDGRLFECLGVASAVQELVDEVLATEQHSLRNINAWLRTENEKLKAQVKHEIDQKSEMASNYTDAALDRDRAERDNQRIAAGNKVLATENLRLVRELRDLEDKISSQHEGFWYKECNKYQAELKERSSQLAARDEQCNHIKAAREKAEADLKKLKADYESGFMLGTHVSDWRVLDETIKELYITLQSLLSTLLLSEGDTRFSLGWLGVRDD